MSLTSYRAAPPRVTSVNPKGLSRLREPLCGSCFIRANLQDLSLVPSVSRVVAYRVTDANRGAICRLIQRKSRSDLSRISSVSRVWAYRGCANPLVCRALGTVFRARRGNFLAPEAAKAA